MKQRRQPPAVRSSVPLLSIEGTARECGVQLGQAWRDTLHLYAARQSADEIPWWKDRSIAPLLRKLAPHVPDLFVGMAGGAGLPENRVSTPEPEWLDGCTSFAVAPSATLDGQPISGQTKDTTPDRERRFQVLRMRLVDAPSMLLLTYPGWLCNHGFVEGRCAMLGNSLYAGRPRGTLGFGAWVLLAMHCRRVEDAVEMTRRHGTSSPGHRTIADEHGGIVGIELWAGGIGVLRPRRGIYTHANAVVSSKRWARHERFAVGTRDGSLHRQDRLRELLLANHGRLTAPLAQAALTDQQGHPAGISRHESPQATTTAAIILEPTRRLIHVTRGAPDRNFPTMYSL